MKKKLIVIVAFIVSLPLMSCLEWGETLNFYVENNTDQNILFIQKGDFNKPDTVILAVGERVLDWISESTGNAAPYPFQTCDTIFIVYNNTLMNIYPRTFSGKSPFNFDLYEEIDRKEEKHSTTIDYKMSILNSDFHMP